MEAVLLECLNQVIFTCTGFTITIKHTNDMWALYHPQELDKYSPLAPCVVLQVRSTFDFQATCSTSTACTSGSGDWLIRSHAIITPHTLSTA